MKKIVLFLLLSIVMAISVVAQTSVPASNGIRFEEGLNWEKVLEKAKAANKYVFVDVYTTWCGPCKMMDLSTYPDSLLGVSMNNKFISVKMQMDTTVNDDALVKSRYTDAHQLSKRYKIPGYPCLLFFAPDGQLIGKEIGFRNASQFMALLPQVLDPQSLQFNARVEAYRKGEKEYPALRELAITASSLHDNKELADSIALDYNSYLNKKGDSATFQKEDFDFIQQFHYLIKPEDLLFRVMYQLSGEVDKVMGQGWSAFYVFEVIKRMEIKSKIFVEGQPLPKDPDWSSIEATITAKFPGYDAKYNVLRYRIVYYEKGLQDWARWAMAVDEKNEKFPPEKGRQATMELNDNAWKIFLNCTGKQVLEKALKWVDLNIKMNDNPIQEMDTRANLLYKLGRIDEAIRQEQQAIDLGVTLAAKAGFTEDQLGLPALRANLDLMKKRKPTGLNQGAKWLPDPLPGK